LGFAQDADADRLALVNERGEPLGEDCTVALVVKHLLARKASPVVVNVSTSRMVDDVASQFNCTIHHTRVGEIHVVERMIECGAEVGGEGNGGVIIPAVNPCRDSFVGMAFLLEALAFSGACLSGLRSGVPTYAIVKEKLICRARDIAPSLRLLEKLHQGEQLDRTDGLKVIWPDRWLHAHPSTTEPIIRLIAEAPTESEARSLMAEAIECLCPTA